MSIKSVACRLIPQQDSEYHTPFNNNFASNVAPANCSGALVSFLSFPQNRVLVKPVVCIFTRMLAGYSPFLCRKGLKPSVLYLGRLNLSLMHDCMQSSLLSVNTSRRKSRFLTKASSCQLLGSNGATHAASVKIIGPPAVVSEANFNPFSATTAPSSFQPETGLSILR